MAAAALAGDDLTRATSSRRSWRSQSIRDVWQGPPDVFMRSSTRRQDMDDEEELRWAAIERLPTYDRLRKGMLQQVVSNGRVVHSEVDVANLGAQDKKQLMESILKVVEDDNEKFLQRLRNRTDRVGIEIPKIEVRFQNVSIEGDAYVGKRALPTLLNSTINTLEAALGMIGLSPSKKRVVKILKNVSGIVRPSRMTLLLGPPGSGKTTLLKALAGKPDDDMKVTGKITYCGHEFHEFVPQRTCAYISQHDLHHGEMTVRETLDFSGRCLGVGTRYEMLVELSRREKEAGIKPDPEIDAFMKATALVGQETSMITDYVLKILGLDICADIMVGDDMRRGISGGQKKRVTTGEMLVGPAKAFFMDEISTGLDSSTTFQIAKFMRQMVHINDITMVISLLQPAPETFELFDDVILLSDGEIVYQGPRECVLEFFEYMGFRCPERKGVADFLQEVTSKKDQEQYWCRKNQPYRYVSVPEFAQAFNSFHIGQQLVEDLRVPYDKSRIHPAALVKEKYGISNWELFRACFAREWLLMKRSSFIYIFKTTQITIMATIALTVFLRTEMKAGQINDAAKFWGALFFSLINVMFNGMQELAMTVFRLPVFFKQRDSLFYPAWAFALPIWVLRIPISVVESALWIIFTYYTIGFAPSPVRFFKQLLAFIGVHQMALSLFRFIAAVGRTQVVANTFGTFALLLVFVLGGFVVAKDDIKDWMIWGYYVSPMMYGQNAIAINEFLAERWNNPAPTNASESTVGKTLLKDRGLFTTESWYWICIIALFSFSLLFNVLFVAALTYLNPLGDNKAIISDEKEEKKTRRITANGEVAFGSVSAAVGPSQATGKPQTSDPRRAAEKRKAVEKTGAEASKKKKVDQVPPPVATKSKGKEVVGVQTSGRAARSDITFAEASGYFASLQSKNDELNRKNDDLKKKLAVVEAEVAKQRKEIARKDEQLKSSQQQQMGLQAELAAANSALIAGAREQGEVLRAFAKRLFLTDKFSDMANELAGVLSKRVACAVLRMVAEKVPELEVEQFGYKDPTDRELYQQYVAVVKKSLGELPLLNALASSSSLLTAQAVERCDVDRHEELSSLFSSSEEEIFFIDEESGRSKDASPTATEPTLPENPEGFNSGAPPSDVECAETARLQARVAELEEKLVEADKANATVQGRMLADHRRLQRREDKLREKQLEIDELHARLLQAQEELEVEKIRAEQVIRDHERIVEEHQEYEEIIHAGRGRTISESEAHIGTLLKAYFEAKEERGPGAEDTIKAYEAIRDEASCYGLIVQRKPKLRDFLLKMNAGPLTLFRRGPLILSTPHDHPEPKKKKKGRPPSSQTRGGRSGQSSRKSRLSIDDILNA